MNENDVRNLRKKKKNKQYISDNGSSISLKVSTVIVTGSMTGRDY